jgi:hypothetical protein
MLNPHPFALTGVLLSAAAFYTASNGLNVSRVPIPTHRTQREQILVVLKEHYIAPLLANRDTAFLTKDVIQEFYRTQGRLLITGTPEADKTTALLVLMKHLVERSDDNHPIPLLLSVAQWTHDQDNLIQWIQREAARHYAIPETVTLDWLAQEQIALLFDNFDDLPHDFQTAFSEHCGLFLNSRIPIVCSASYGAHTPALKGTLDLNDAQSSTVSDIPLTAQDQASHQLSYLAHQITYRKQQTFFIEDLDRTWLEPRQRLWAGIAARLSILLFVVVVCALVLSIGLSIAGKSRSLFDMLQGGAMIGAFWGGILVLLLGGAEPSPKAYEPMRFSISNMRYTSYLHLSFGLSYAPVVGLLFGIVPALRFGLSEGVQIGVIAALLLGIGQTIVNMMATISAPAHIEVEPHPNMHIGYALDRASMSLARALLLGGGTFALLILIRARTDRLGEAIYFGLALGSIIGTFASLAGGGLAVIRHMIVRLMLYRTGSLPLNMTRFLQDMASQGVLVAVGSGFQFRDKSVQAHFAQQDASSACH